MFDVSVDEDLECKVEALLRLIDVSDASAQRRHDELRSALTTVEKMEHDLHENIELLKSIRDRVSSFCVFSANVSLMKNVRHQLLVSQHLTDSALILLFIFLLFYVILINYYCSKCSLVTVFCLVIIIWLFVHALMLLKGHLGLYKTCCINLNVC